MTTNSALLARTITCNASKQSYLTARLMVDDHLEDDCYRAYAYFRWVDDQVDIECHTRQERLEFIERQKRIVERCYRNQTPTDLISEEQILVDLIQNAQQNAYLLCSYIDNFLAIIAFDAERKGRLITQSELDWYATTLGKAVTDGIQYFVCNGYPYPDSERRYLAATAAHVIHMLRDLHEDIPEGYINIPVEAIEEYGIDLDDLDSPQMRRWIQNRVDYARDLFGQGKDYLNNLTVLRCRIVGHWYCARFERLLNTIENDGFHLRHNYPKPNKVFTWLKFTWIGLLQTFNHVGYHLKNGSGPCGFPQKNTSANSFEVLSD